MISSTSAGKQFPSNYFRRLIIYFGGFFNWPWEQEKRKFKKKGVGLPNARVFEVDGTSECLGARKQSIGRRAYNRVF